MKVPWLTVLALVDFVAVVAATFGWIERLSAIIVIFFVTGIVVLIALVNAVTRHQDES